jgi:hypothetical protein
MSRKESRQLMGKVLRKKTQAATHRTNCKDDRSKPLVDDEATLFGLE